MNIQPSKRVNETKQHVQHDPHFRAEQWEARSAWPLLVLSLIFVGLSTLVLADNDLTRATVNFAGTVMLVLWAVFLIDFSIRLLLSRSRFHYLRTHILEAISLILPVLRPFLLVLYLWRLPQFKRKQRYQRLRFMIAAASFGLVFVYVASTLVFIAEHNAPGATIVSFGDAIWWGFVTITTVGYGDYYPVTLPGRFFAVGLMLGGIVIVGIVSATVISSLNEQMQKTAVSKQHRSETPSQQRSLN